MKQVYIAIDSFFWRVHLGLQPKTGWHGGYLLASVREVHLERRVTHHKIKLTQLLSVIALVVWAYKRVALNSIIKRRHKSVKQQIKFQHFVASLGNILRKMVQRSSPI